MALIPPESVGRRLALKVLSRLDGANEPSVFEACEHSSRGKAPGGHEGNQQNLKNGFLDAADPVANPYSTPR